MVNIQFEVPKDMMKIATDPETQNKPYDLCLKCPFMKETCDGPNVLSMEYSRWVEWANARAKQLSLTRLQISELSMVPKGTVDAALSGRNADIRSATMRDITKVLIGGCWGKYPCHIAALLMRGELTESAGDMQAIKEELDLVRRDLTAARGEAADLHGRLKSADERGAAAVEKAEADAQKKIDYLKRIVDDLQAASRWYKKIIVAMGVFCSLSIVGVLLDIAIGSIGWFRY